MKTTPFKTNIFDDNNIKENPLVYKVFYDYVTKDMSKVYGTDDPNELIVLDFIAGMTDNFAMRSLSDIFIPKLLV